MPAKRQECTHATMKPEGPLIFAFCTLLTKVLICHFNQIKKNNIQYQTLSWGLVYPNTSEIKQKAFVLHIYIYTKSFFYF